MHDTPTISAERRDKVGTRYAQRLRNSGKLPAVIYGHQTDPVAVAFDKKEIINILREGAHVLNVNVGDDKSETCLVKDLQFGYLGDNVIHIDLARVDLNEEVTVNVSLNFVGEPAALKAAGAVLRHDLTQLEVICKVSAIPDEIVVDISEMEQVISVGEIVMPEGVRCTMDEQVAVTHITYVAEVSEDGEGAELDADLESEPEVISEAKEDGGDAKADAGDGGE